jgi:hypothetical protein
VAKSKKTKGRCYVCGKPAISRDHVPPKALFPEARADKGPDAVDYRKNLVTVPSCADHNEARSLDDQYAGFVLALNLGVNGVATEHFIDRIVPALERRPALIRLFFRDAQRIRVDGQETMSYTVDLPRWEAGIRKITAGAYHAITGFRIPDFSVMRVFSPDIRFPNMEAPYAPLVERVQNYTTMRDFVSGHPSVYRARYAISETRARQFFFEHTFYDGFRAWVISDPGDALWLK